MLKVLATIATTAFLALSPVSLEVAEAGELTPTSSPCIDCW